MISRFKKIIITVLIMTYLMTSLSVYVSAATVESDNKVYMLYNEKNKEYTVQSYFNPSHKIVSGEKWSLSVGKNVKQAYVRAQSDGLKAIIRICGSYDSGRLYSKVASNSKPDTIISTAKASVKKCSTCVQKLNYGWIYY